MPLIKQVIFGIITSKMMQPSMQDIVALSDDETGCDKSQQVSVLGQNQGEQLVAAQRRPAKRKRPCENVMACARPNVQILRRKVEGSCGCLCHCFKPFRESARFDKLIEVRSQLLLLDKLDQDNFDMVMSQNRGAMTECPKPFFFHLKEWAWGIPILRHSHMFSMQLQLRSLISQDMLDNTR